MYACQSRLRLVLVVPLLLLSACADPGASSDADKVLFDSQLVRADRGAPFIRFGERRGSIVLGAGWTQLVREATGDYVWVEGKTASFAFEAPHAGAFEVILRVRPFHFPGAPAQLVELAIDGTVVASRGLQPGWQILRLPAALRPGPVAAELRFARAWSPAKLSDSKDRRELAARVQTLAIVPAEMRLREAQAARVDAETRTLHLPRGGICDLPLAGPGRAVLRLGAASGPAATLRLELGEGQHTKRIWRGRAADTDGLELAFDLEGRGPARLRIRREFVPTEPREELILELPEAWLTVERSDGTGEEPAPHVFVYVIDTLRADALETYGYERPTSPALSAFAREAVTYERAWSPAAWTLPATLSLLTGLHPHRHGVLSGGQRLEPGRTTALPLRLAERGYDTVAVSHSFVAGPRFGVDAGFERFFLSDELGGMSLASQTVRGTLLEWLWDRAEPERPVFAYLHTVDPHGPYVRTPELERVAGTVRPGRLAPEDYKPNLFLKEDHAKDARENAWLRALYDGEVAYADRELGRFVAMLKLLGLWENSLVAVVSDHGEEFLEHGAYDHGKAVHEEILRVPLLVKFPHGRFAGTRVSERVSTLDLVRTILSLSGDTEGLDLDGENLAPDAIAARSQPRLTLARAWAKDQGVTGPIDYVAVALDHMKVIHSANQKDQLGNAIPTWQVFDLAEDPGEEHPLSEDDPRAEWILQKARPLVDHVRAQGQDSTTPEVDEATLEALRALGYVR